MFEIRSPFPRPSGFGLVTISLLLLGLLTGATAAPAPQDILAPYQIAKSTDWEEINFEYNEAVLTDGFPSLLRLAELLSKNPPYRVKLEGHTDQIGPVPYNQTLALRRAQAVKTFLLKYGAKDSQVETVSVGKANPRVPSEIPTARFMNRRVTLIVTDGQGKIVSDGGVGEAVNGLEQRLKEMSAKAEQCCDDILKRLNKLDDILAAVKDLANQNRALQSELDRLKNDQSRLADQLAKNNTGTGPTPAAATPVVPPAPATPTGQSGEPTRVVSRSPSRFTILGANAGADANGGLTMTGRARYFQPFNEKFALQAQGEYMYFRDRQEGQFDLGLVTRFQPRWQTGLFSSFKTVNLRDYASNGTLGQAAITFDYLFSRGRVGAFGTKSFLDEAVVGSRQISQNIRLESYLKVADQVGMSGSVGLWGNNFAEGNFGYLHGRNGTPSRPGGTVRLVFPVNEHIAMTLEGGMNETLLSPGPGQNGRVVAGVLFGNMIRPKDMLTFDGPVPVDVPRVRYQLLQRRVRTGFSPPVADAGPDQIGVAAGTITLDGSGSYHPDGDPLTYQWQQVAGPAVAITGTTLVRATFPAEEGQSYAFRLTVKDPQGAIAVARTVVTTRAAAPLRIARWQANPATIRAGQTTTLSWQVDNAEQVEISGGIGRVDARQGSVQVSPQETTTYRLTARARGQEINETITVTVERQSARVLIFTASPMTINAGQSTTLTWQTENAESVEIRGVGAVGTSGSQQVTPRETTTYTLVARNRFGDVTATTTIRVNPGSTATPRILRFVAAPPEIQSGENATLLWAVEGARSIEINTVGSELQASGTASVSPTATTTYTLRARNDEGESTATVTVTVVPAARIISFTASPASVASGSPSTLSWVTEGGTVTLSAAGTVDATSSFAVRPTQTTTYTLTVVGRRSTVSQQITVTVTGSGGGGNPGGGRGPIADAGPNQITLERTVTLDGSKSYHPDGKLIRFSWRAVGRAPLEIRGGDTPRPTVIFSPINGYGDYVFELTVTDADGKFATSTVRVFYGAY